MADARRADRGMSCPRCKNSMDELLRIAPTANTTRRQTAKKSRR
jgi:hypothetical protein